jgi:hypothetical protein
VPALLLFFVYLAPLAFSRGTAPPHTGKNLKFRIEGSAVGTLNLEL